MLAILMAGTLCNILLLSVTKIKTVVLAKSKEMEIELTSSEMTRIFPVISWSLDTCT